MTVTSNRAPRRGGPAPQPADGVLLRLSVADTAVLAELPAAPGDRAVTVSFSTRAAAGAAAPALEAAGYRSVGVARARTDQAVADFLVPQKVLDQHPEWWRSLAGHAQQTFSLAAGPVHVAFAEVLQAHRGPRR